MIMAQTLFKRLHERHPNLILDVLAPAWTLALLQHMPEVNEAIALPFGHGELKLLDRYRFGKSLRARQYDQAIVLPNSLKSALIPFFARIPQRTGFVGEMRYGLLNDARKLDKQALPLMVDRFCQLAKPAKSPPTPLLQSGKTAISVPPFVKGGPRGNLNHGPNLGQLSPCLHVEESEQHATLHMLGLTTDKPIAAFCIGAEYGPAKRWPASYFAELGKILTGNGYDIWLIGSSKEAEIGASIEQSSGGLCHNLCGKTNLSEAIDMLAASDLVVSNDSGLMHVAAALDKPMLALYGSSSPGFTPPLSDKARVVSLNLECSPCFERECPLGHFNCMMQLTPERVAEEIEKLRSS
jgi:heptosyltransferase-2